MQRIFLLLVLAAFAGACEKRMVIANNCPGSWVRVIEGRGDLLHSRIEYGQAPSVDLANFAGYEIRLVASGFELGTDRKLGSVDTIRFVAGSGGPTSPRQIDPWTITWLPGGCPGRR